MLRFSVFCFFKQKTAYEMRISAWSSDVCSSDLPDQRRLACVFAIPTCTGLAPRGFGGTREHIGRAGQPGKDAGFRVIREQKPKISDGGERSEGRRVGKECVRPCRSRRSP